MTDLRSSLDNAEPLYGERFRHDPAVLYADIRSRHGPVAPVLLDGDIPAWFVIGYRELHQVASNSDLFARDTRRWNMWDRVPGDWPLMPYVMHNPSVMFAEAEEHRRRAGALGDALGAFDQFEIGMNCERIADSLIDTFAGRGEAELMSEYVLKMPLSVLATMYGLPEGDIPTLVHDIRTSLDVGPDAGPAYGRVQQAMAALLERKRELPGPDVPSTLLEHPAGLTDEEISLDLLVVASAAQQPTANWIGNTLRLMLTDERFALTLAGGRESVGQALTEVLWHDTPTQNFIGRFAARDTELAGRRIRAGDLLVLGLSAANTDPNVRLALPDATGNRAHMSFGHGEHGCPYPAPEVAEVIAKTSVEVLLDRLPDLNLGLPAEDLVWHPSVWMRGLTELPVTFTPTVV
ncbi:cytochrome P450 [Saccharomonospora iraqiensis]|uniref:cytochrome P450 n=1 Tax=Saccharomonospora iraqiensis TaxID=52698 RepID=UPI00022E041E|nr:cytochrome P450 [Saccharomonospora iraqiensis]